ncbi:MAG: DNA-3-methyladenine glycosylase [Ktedonobacteraceae bacterium]
MIHTALGYIMPIAPYDFAKSLNFLGFFSPMQGEQATTEQALTKAVYVDGQLIAFRLASTGTTDKPQLAYTLFSEQPIDSTTENVTRDRISFFLSLNDDLRPFYTIGREDADFAPIVEELYGYHQVKFLTPFETACWAVLTQRNPMNMSQKMKKSLVATYSSTITVDGVAYTAFPEAARMAHVSEDELTGVVRNARKAEYLIAVIKAFNDVDEHFLRTGDYDEVEKWLRSIRGFGEWSASFVLVRGLGRMEHLTSNEKVMLAAASRLYGHGEDLTRAEVERIAEQYGPYKGYWGHYLRVGS